ncbi:MAG TPA: PRC-barrel domain-containing protein [Geminicoccus sp.]|jgi:sporulation protein YlmC with PRC-barrel domain|uniref:PRC-barrel domain-containing protein n=1 Tax=Geminicoccus sp. TaxID=2024832 RepID=UPI002E30FAD4|nr:PRC-barrel domain-containing protein [Geminicoccus sp.]HEX2528813.1 PRC-barrel domain-containing protein [Geminicoccus sp.]
MKSSFISAIALATAFVTPTLAQETVQKTAATAQQDGGNQQLQMVQQRLQQAFQSLQQAAQGNDNAGFDQAKQEARQALQELRQGMDQLPQEQRFRIEGQMGRAEQTLQGDDPNAAARTFGEVVAIVAEPDQNDGQGAQILVEQVAPRLTVTQPEPEVTVRQQQPEIIVRQPRPTVTVDIPQPEIIVRMPEPEVSVSQAQPQVQVRQSEPQVSVQPAEPDVDVESGQPEVRVQQLADDQSNVEFEGNRQPQVRYEQVEPRVVVNQQEGQPQIRIERQGEQQQGQAQQQNLADQQQMASTQQDAANDSAARLAGMRIGELMNKSVYGANGENIGDVEDVVINRKDMIGGMVVGVGGFLGIGERQILIPFEQVTLDDTGRLVTDFNKARVEQMPAFDDAGYERVQPGQSVSATWNRETASSRALEPGGSCEERPLRNDRIQHYNKRTNDGGDLSRHLPGALPVSMASTCRLRLYQPVDEALDCSGRDHWCSEARLPRGRS